MYAITETTVNQEAYSMLSFLAVQLTLSIHTMNVAVQCFTSHKNAEMTVGWMLDVTYNMIYPIIQVSSYAVSADDAHYR